MKIKTRKIKRKYNKKSRVKKQKGGNNDIYGFHHICFKGNGKQIFESQFKKLKDSGLYDITKKIFCSVIGDRNSYKFPDKYSIIYESPTTEAYERPILEHLYKISLTTTGKYWYIHTKGVRHHNTPSENNVIDWRNFLEYFVIEKWKQCVKDLDTHDIVGVNFIETAFFTTNPSPHFSGNFWWTKSDYVKTNEPKFSPIQEYTIYQPEYYDTEMYICKGRKPIKILSYHSSNKKHYEESYPKENYNDDTKLIRIDKEII